ncbi:MAG: sugar MFS transporter [Candidatus Binatia bacterium]
MRKTNVLLVILVYLGFVSIGLPDGLLGVAWPSIRSFFQLPLPALGALLIMFTTGYVFSSFSSGHLLSRINLGTLLALSCLATAVSLLGYALTPVWWVMVALGTFAGLGAGAIDAGLNTYAATNLSARSVNWLHACYGLGAASGPLLMTTVLGAGYVWQWGYGVVGIGQLLLAVSFSCTLQYWPSPSRAGEVTTLSSSAASGSSTLQRPVMWLSMAAFFVYTGLEAAAGAWAYSLSTEARAISMHTAGFWVSIYWSALTAGRVLFGLIAGKASIPALLTLCMLTIASGAMLLWLHVTDALSFLGLTLMGLASGPIFPSLIATTPERLGDAHTANGVGFQIAAAALGQALLPAFVGIAAQRSGLEIVGPTLLAASILLLIVYTSFPLVSRRLLPLETASSKVIS